MPFLYENLSPSDFERLCGELLGEEHGVEYRTFAAGADKGIDLLALTDGARTIVQCKHYLKSTWSDLKKSLRKEIIKIRGLRRRGLRYIICTSLELSVAQFEDIQALLKPYLRSPNDIYDRRRIDDLLETHTDVLHRHYKLWLASSDVLDRINSADVVSRTSGWRERVLGQAQKFVEPSNIGEARKILNDDRVLIISGAPGVGKTTLADIFALDYMSRGYSVYIIGDDVNEAEAVFRVDQRQLFMYDDFLGKTTLTERLGHNEEHRLLEFMRRVKRYPRHRFILTTREYILKAARLQYEELRRANLDLLKHVLEVTEYSRLHRAQILYNHLYFAEGLGPADLEHFVSCAGYKPVIQHPNYTPRHIADAVKLMTRDI